MTQPRLAVTAAAIRRKLVSHPHPSSLWCRAEVEALADVGVAVGAALAVGTVGALVRERRADERA